MTQAFKEYSISSDRDRINESQVHFWLTNTYWSPGVSRERVIEAMDNSALVVGAYLEEKQVGYMRLVSDKTTFSWISDVYVDEAHRGKGLAKAMVAFSMEHPEFAAINRWLLATRDAHDVYKPLGFGALEYPDHFMWKGIQIPPPQ